MMIPMGCARISTEGARAVVALCLPISGYIGGQKVEVAGGL